jgi:hypothetical protein
MANTAEQKNQLARVNRKLAPKYEKTLSSRSEREKQYLGNFYVLDSYQNAVIDTHVNLDHLEAELTNAANAIRRPSTLDPARNEVLTLRLVESFNAGIFLYPWEFSEEEIDCIAGWSGMDDKATFTTGDERLVAEYGLNLALGENTYPRFAEVLRKEKAEWDELYRADANLTNGEKLLEAAVDACVVAGMSKDAITRQVDQFCHLNGQ